MMYVAALMATAAVSAKVPLEYADSVRADGLVNMFVVSGGAPTAAMLADDNWVYPENISQADKPDSELNILYHHSGKILAGNKSTVYRLFPGVKTYVLNGKKIKKSEFDVIPAAFINSVDFSGKTLSVETRADVNASNPALDELRTAETEWQRRQYARVKTDIISRTIGDVALTDLASYPSKQLFAVNAYLHTPQQTAEMAGADSGIGIVGFGDLLLTSVNTSGPVHLEQPGGGVARMVEFDNLPSSMTVKELIARSEIPVSEVNFINIYKGHVAIGTYNLGFDLRWEELTTGTAILEHLTLPKFNDAVTKHIVSHIRYPEQAAINGRSASLAYRVTVDKQGNIHDYKFDPELSSAGSEEFVDAGNAVFSNIPALTPATYDGQPCAVSNAVMRLIFYLSGSEQPKPLATSPFEI